MQNHTGRIRNIEYEVSVDGTVYLDPLHIPDTIRDEVRLAAAAEFLGGKLTPAQREYWRAVSRVEKHTAGV